LQICWEIQEYRGFVTRKLLILNIHGGWPSLERTRLWVEFPANREKYREISEIRFKSLPEQVYMMLNPREFAAMNLDF
jgi:hypothetical protein